MIKKILLLSLLLSSILLGNDEVNNKVEIMDKPTILPSFPDERLEIPMIPLNPALPTKVENIDEEGNIRHLEKNYTLIMESKIKIFVPLEIISDISVNATLFGDETAKIPFDIELNREPEKKDFYKIIYSEKEIDIDNDGKKDTFIFSPEYANTKIITNNYVEIQGKNISKDGEYQKKVYITIEAGI